MPIRDMLLPEFDREMANTRKLLELVPEEDFDFKPHPKSMSMGRLAGHVAELPGWVVPTMQRELLELDPEKHKPYVPQSRKELLESFDKNVREARAALAAATDEQLGVAWTLKVGGKAIFTMPRFAVFRAMVMSHMIHHRAQLGVYLRVTEIEIPGMYGPSADEMKPSA
ncbi:MAG: DinB family protein [Candidatus Korobacteraceae bacterium]|jgi:uncharacterized damage-inducible protein DinB